MTVQEQRENVRERYIKWYMTKNNQTSREDASYTWWDREKNCQQWCDRERTFVPMSETKTLKIMRAWFNSHKTI